MKYFLRLLAPLLLLFIINACQKELNFENNPISGQADGTLQSSSGICLPATVNGIYTKDSVLKTTNSIQVTALITVPGLYTIKSDTIDGISFIGSGTVTGTGIKQINLSGIGTPTLTGIKTFTIRFGISTCKIDVNVVAGVPPNAVFSYINCSGITYGTGVYTVGTATDPAVHTVTLPVSVTTAGAYSINVAAVNGVSFAGSGTFPNPGNTTVTLTASGTPTVASPPPYSFSVASGGSTCSFSITCNGATPPPNLDYVPQTSFSNWSTSLVGGTAADTTYLQVSTNSRTFGANSYKIFEVKDMGVPTDSVYNRKNGGMYYQYIDGDLGVLQNPINQEYMLLDSAEQVAFTWTKNFGPNVAMGFPLTNIRVRGEILAKGETKTVANIVYNNVIRVKYNYIATVFLVGDVPVAEEERWYAKGKGVIYSKITNQVAPATIEVETTRTQIF